MTMCVWEPEPACLTEKWELLDIDVRDRALMLATSSLQMLTNNRVGTCPITVRPCPVRRPCGCEWSPYRPAGSFMPVDWDGVWTNSCACRSECKPVSEVVLPGPVGYVASIKVDGTEVDLSTGDIRLDDGYRLVWQGSGPSPFPETQDLSKPDTEPGTWSVTYSRSHAIAEDGRIAVAYLAMEFAKACAPQGKCALPRGVTSVVRNGVSFNIEAGLFPNGLTGIEIVDAFILKWAPAGSPTRNAVVFDPRQAQHRVSSALPTRRS